MSRPTAQGGTRARILRTAGRLFAERGYHGTSIAELGAATGVSGPALYKHFPSKEAVLGELLVGCSRRLLDGAGQLLTAGGDDAAVLGRLVEFHVDFALGEPELILVQHRDWAQLAEADRRSVRRLQRAYVETWTTVLGRLRPELDAERRRACVQAVFGLMNSTPHSVGSLARPQMAALLRDLALTALLTGGCGTGSAPGERTCPDAAAAEATG